MLKNKETVIKHLDNEILKRKNNPYEKVNYEFFEDKKYDLHRNDEDVVRKAISIHPKCISYSKLKNDREFVLDATKNIDYYTFTYADDKFRKDKDIIQSAMDKKAYMFKFADESIRYNESFALKAVTADSFNLECVSDRLKNNLEFVLEAIKSKPSAMKYASEEIRDICKDKDPIKILESVIFAEKLQQSLSHKPNQTPTKRLKI